MEHIVEGSVVPGRALYTLLGASSLHRVVAKRLVPASEYPNKAELPPPAPVASYLLRISSDIPPAPLHSQFPHAFPVGQRLPGRQRLDTTPTAPTVYEELGSEMWALNEDMIARCVFIVPRLRHAHVLLLDSSYCRGQSVRPAGEKVALVAVGPHPYTGEQSARVVFSSLPRNTRYSSADS